MRQPRKSSLNPPTLRYDFPFWFDSFRNIHGSSKSLADFLKGFSITRISANTCERGIFQAGFLEDGASGYCVMDVRGVNFYEE